jgi:hypothetical protein
LLYYSKQLSSLFQKCNFDPRCICSLYLKNKCKNITYVKMSDMRFWLLDAYICTLFILITFSTYLKMSNKFKQNCFVYISMSWPWSGFKKNDFLCGLCKNEKMCTKISLFVRVFFFCLFCTVHKKYIFSRNCLWAHRIWRYTCEYFSYLFTFKKNPGTGSKYTGEKKCILCVLNYMIQSSIQLTWLDHRAPVRNYREVSIHFLFK